MKITYIILLLSFVGCGSNVVQFKDPDNTVSNDTTTECTDEQKKSLENCFGPVVDSLYLCNLKQIECLGQCAKVCYNDSLNVVDCVCQDYSACYTECQVSCNFNC